MTYELDSGRLPPFRGLTLDTSRPIRPVSSASTQPATPPAPYERDIHRADEAEAERDGALTVLKVVRAERDEAEAERDEALAMLVALRRDLAIHIRRADDAQARLGAARLAVNELLHREHRHTGHGRDGHLDETDIAIVTAALGAYAERTEDEADRLTPTKIAKETQTDE